MPDLALSFEVSSAILTFASFFGVFLMLQKSSFRRTTSRPASTALICFLLIGLAAAMNTMHYGFFSGVMNNTQHLINTAVSLITPPLLTAVLISIGWQIKWKNRTGWIIFILNCLLIWLAKLAGRLEYYQVLLLSTALAISLITVIRSPFRHPSSTLFLIIAIGAYTTGFLVISYFEATIVFLGLDFFHYLTALGNLFLASGLFQLMRKGSFQKPVNVA